MDAQIFFIARLPRALAAALVGGTLAAAGVVFQGLLRNPLATPYTLGVSAGASLGAMIAITFGAGWAVGGVASASLAGAFLAVGIVYALASARHRGLSTTVLLLAGVTLNAFFSALILFVQYLSDFAQTFRALRWLMGDLDVASYAPIVSALPLVGRRVRGVRVAGAAAQSAQPRRGGRRHARRRRRARAARGVLRRVAGHRRGRLGRRPDRLCRHHRAAPGAAASSAPTTAWCCPRPRSSARRFWSRAT